MKVVLGLFVVIGLALAGMYFGGVFDMGMEGQQEDFANTVKPGMTWQSVADVKEPKRVSFANEELGYGAPGKFDRAEFDRRATQPNGYGLGFKFPYHFSNEHSYEVIFDDTGKVVEVIEARSANDLLYGNTR